jgi:hypothetical protein
LVAVSKAQARIREAVIRYKRVKLTALQHQTTVDVRRAALFGLNLKRRAVLGIDAMMGDMDEQHR